MKAMFFSPLWRMTSLMILLSLMLASCVPALTLPAPTSTPLPPSPSPTHTATATPSPLPTLTPTETPVPDPWIELLAEQREYVPGGIGLGEKTGRILKFHPWADQKAIHDQILASQMRQLMIPENKPILDILLQQHPEWIGTSWNSVANPFELRLQIMNAVMEITGGRLFTKLWPSNQVALWDANQPVQFECEQSQQVPSRPEFSTFGTDNGVAIGVSINSEGSLVYREEFTNEYLANGYEITSKPFDFYCSYRLLRIAENQAIGFTSWESFVKNESTFLDYRKFALDLKDPSALKVYEVWQESFLKSK